MVVSSCDTTGREKRREGEFRPWRNLITFPTVGSGSTRRRSSAGAVEADLCVESTGNFPDSETTCAVFPRGERTRGAPALPHQRRVGRKKPGESSVMESVQPIYRAIHRKHYRPRRRRLDQRPKGNNSMPVLSTPRGDCDRGCPHLAEFLAPVKPTLASDKTGC